MKINRHLLTLASALCAGLLTVTAAEKKVEGGPKGGRILDKTSPQAEFCVGKDRVVTVAFYDARMKPVPATDQGVTVIVDTKDGKAKLEFDKQGDVLVSRTRLPEGEGYNVVVQFRQSADAKPQNFRFKLDLHTCGECHRAEYACICVH